MKTEILMPSLSPTMEEGSLAKWYVNPGDKVKPGDIIADIETDKALMEYESIEEGIILDLLVKEGTENIKVNSLIAIIETEGVEEKDLDSGQNDSVLVKKSEETTHHGEGKNSIISSIAFEENPDQDENGNNLLNQLTV